MILFFGMQLIPLGYGILYLIHSVKKRRTGQAVAMLVLLLVLLASFTVLLWEFFAMP